MSKTKHSFIKIEHRSERHSLSAYIKINPQPIASTALLGSHRASLSRIHKHYRLV